MKIIKYFKGISWPIWVILFFCAAGFLRNAYQLSFFGFDYGSSATKVLVAMLVIYAAQIILILMRESKAWLISAVQVCFCIYVYEDFTFLPVTAFIKNVAWYFFPAMSYGWVKFMGTALISALFSLEILKTYILLALTEELPRRKPKKRAARAQSAKSQPA